MIDIRKWINVIHQINWSKEGNKIISTDIEDIW